LGNLSTTLGNFFFKYRGFIPVPFVLVVLYFAQPTITSFILGICIMLIGEWIRFWGVAYAGGSTRTRNVGAPRLITSGPFGYVRNPLYIGNMIMYAGVALITNVWMPYLVIVVLFYFGIQYYFIIMLEEKKLNELFKEEYEDYAQSISRFLPRLKPIISAKPTKPDYSNALRSEKSTFMSFSTIVILFALKMALF
jgi:protein-S-isoprenylcysteine O-methyltransferase Ste14